MSLKERRIIGIVAMTESRVIGKDGDLPWKLPEDLKFFKRTTQHHAVLMGRKTWESIGRPLPNRRNIILSRTMDQDDFDDVEVIQSVEELPALEIDTDLFVIGGAEIYGYMMPQMEELYVSFVFDECAGDTFFPEFEDQFSLEKIVAIYPDFEVRRYLRNAEEA